MTLLSLTRVSIAVADESPPGMTALGASLSAPAPSPSLFSPSDLEMTRTGNVVRLRSTGPLKGRGLAGHERRRGVCGAFARVSVPLSRPTRFEIVEM